MKILVLAPQWPDPAQQGAAIRNLQILLYLAKWHEVYLLTFTARTRMETARLKSACVLAEALPAPSRTSRDRLQQLAMSGLPDMAWRLRSDAMESRVRELCREVQFDAIHVEGIEMAHYGFLAREMLKRNPAPQLVYDAHNAEYRLQQRAFETDVTRPRSLPRALYSLAQWRRLHNFERRLCLASTNIIAVSRDDRAALARFVPEKRAAIKVLPNGVDPAQWSREAGYPPVELPPGDNLVFDGTMDFRPNVDAVLWFADEVWPLVREQRPNARFYIVGRNPAPAVQALSNSAGITVTGAVDDTRGWVAGATVYVVPMRMGGGVRLKVLQAMSMGCAIVSTAMGAEGIAVTAGQEMLVARGRSDFAHSVLLLIKDAALRKRLGNAARELVSARYSWDRLLRMLDEVYPTKLRLATFVEALPDVVEPERPTGQISLSSPLATGQLVYSPGAATGQLAYTTTANLDLKGEQEATRPESLATFVATAEDLPESAATNGTTDDVLDEVLADAATDEPEIEAFDAAGHAEMEEALLASMPTDPNLHLDDMHEPESGTDGAKAPYPASHGTSSALTRQEIESVESVLASFRAVVGSHISLDDLLGQWGRFVGDVERGYGGTIFHYTSELGTRDLLGGLMSQVSPTARRKLFALLAPTDARLITATHEVEDALPGHPDEDIGVWWYRVPSLLRNPDYPKLTSWLRTYPYTRQGFDTWAIES